MSKPTCESCEWWVPCPPNANQTGECRGKKPELLACENDCFEDGQYWGSWPLTCNGDRCGEHSAATKPATKSDVDGLWIEGAPEVGITAMMDCGDKEYTIGKVWADGDVCDDMYNECICRAIYVTRHIPLSALVGGGE